MGTENRLLTLNRHEIDSPGNRIGDIAETYVGFPSHARLGSDEDMSLLEGFSCSGFVTQVIIEAGISRPLLPLQRDQGIVLQKPRRARDYHETCDPVPWGQRKRGDIVVFMKPDKVTALIKPSHVGIVLSTQHGIGHYIHAPGWDNSKVRIEKDFAPIPDYILEQPSLIPQYMQFRRIPPSWIA